MKKTMIMLLVVTMMVSLLSGCTSAGDNQTAGTTQAVQTTDVKESEKETEAVAAEGKTLVVYYSATDNTKRVATVIAEAAGADLFELEALEPYTAADLKWTDDNSRVSREHDNPEQREVELVSTTIDDWDSVSKVYIGYPIWWAVAAWPVNSFIEANDFTGKTVIPFCTSSSSGLGESGELLAELAGTGEWLEGIRFSSGVSEEDVVAWVENLEMMK